MDKTEIHSRPNILHAPEFFARPHEVPTFCHGSGDSDPTICGKHLLYLHQKGKEIVLFRFHSVPIVLPLGGGFFVYLSNGDVPVPFFSLSCLPISYGTKYLEKTIFVEPVVKTSQKGIFC